MVCLRSCPHRLHLPCYAALRVKAGVDLRCPACRAIVTLGGADRIASHQHSDEVMAEALAIARQDIHELREKEGHPQGPPRVRGE